METVPGRGDGGMKKHDEYEKAQQFKINKI